MVLDSSQATVEVLYVEEALEISLSDPTGLETSIPPSWLLYAPPDQSVSLTKLRPVTEVLEKPALAKMMSVTRQTVNAAEIIINTVKEAGVDIRTCQKSPEDLSREQLIACIKASNNLSSKEKVAGDYIPKENAKAGEAQQMLDLEISLLAGE